MIDTQSEAGVCSEAMGIRPSWNANNPELNISAKKTRIRNRVERFAFRASLNMRTTKTMAFTQIKRDASWPRTAFVAALATLAICAACVARAQSPALPKVSVNLLSEQPAVRAAQTVWVGLQFQLPAGWHIYWENPGDSGEPPKMQWNLPPGFRAGDFLWPYPQRIEAPSIVDYGYADGVVLLAPVTAPADLPAHGSVTLGGEVHYLVCRDICVPAKATVQLELPVGAPPAGASTAEAPVRDLFAQTRQRLPQPAPAGWNPRVRLVGDEFVLWLRTGKLESHAEFFPLDTDVIENSVAQEVRATAAGVEIHLHKSDQLLKPPARLRGVVVLPGGQAYRVDAPVTQ